MDTRFRIRTSEQKEKSGCVENNTLDFFHVFAARVFSSVKIKH